MPSIEFIAELPGLTGGVAADRRVLPNAPLRPGHGVGVELSGNGDRAMIGGKHLEDAAHRNRLNLDNAQVAPDPLSLRVQLPVSTAVEFQAGVAE